MTTQGEQPARASESDEEMLPELTTTVPCPPLLACRLARKMADWSKVEAAGVEITVFEDTIRDENRLVERLKPCESQRLSGSAERRPTLAAQTILRARLARQNLPGTALPHINTTCQIPSGRWDELWRTAQARAHHVFIL